MFANKPSLEDQNKAFAKQMRADNRALSRDARSLEREQARIKQQIKAAAAKGDKKTMTILAKSLVRSNKTADGIQSVQSNNMAMQYSMKSGMANAKLAGHMAQSAQVMQKANALINPAQVARDAESYQRAAMQNELAQEMVSDAFDALDDEDLDDLVDQEVDAVLYEVTKGQLGSVVVPQKALAAADEDKNQEEEDLENRMKALF